MCFDFSDFESRKEEDREYEVGAYKTYITLSHSIKQFGTRNAIVYNEVMEELNYCDNEGHLWPIKLFTSRPLDDKFALGPGEPLP